ncbi:cytochrome c oxidase accessory protein CcoG [Flavobacterium sp. CBA20B-1]|uniref:cytochrome c oxidase accessory protein CcoG n=1 Tax=unclassified Flavobacterium TaxID=196869 RepID=UPI0022259BC1|nr:MULTISPECIES: cytochrome c oxidase accessory protein CcoG [unclassified Flavobacterium]WCM42158.1 cytochrome c oxidase accessory protein CcoG [Flavobacterium sp. CBA20B-1]
MSEDHNNFRDRLGTVDEEGKRVWVYPKKPAGKFYNKRKWVSYFLLLILLASPFVKINGNQFFLFNVLERKFSFFGFTFWPQDFYIVVIGMIIGIVFVALFTVVFGRIFCGWICPQTIFMEMVFRRIEYWIEGDRGAQIRLNKQEWNAEKIRKKALKWFVFFIVSFVIANVFLSYIVGSDHVLSMIINGPVNNISTFVSLIIFTAVFYFVFVWFREQVCIIACPYGRLQGVLLDEKTIVVAYDYKRGEAENGRAKFRKNEDRNEKGLGDCIDCAQCVHVCPTGIDIRNGTQLECVNCTACIDACDFMMESVNLPKGLIRYASESEIAKKEKFVFTTRMKGYTAVLLILIGILSGLLFMRSDVEAKILRLPGQLFEHKGDYISNVYTYKIANKSTQNFDNVTIKLAHPEGKIELVGKKSIQIPKEDMAQGTLFIEIPQAVLKSDKTEVQIEVYNNEELIDQTKTNFMSPRSFN